jgi:hypothetical protein
MNSIIHIHEHDGGYQKEWTCSMVHHPSSEHATASIGFRTRFASVSAKIIKIASWGTTHRKHSGGT